MGAHRHPGHQGRRTTIPCSFQWTFPGGIPNPDFIDRAQASRRRRTPPPNWFSSAAPGQRSIAAATAATQAGFTSYNVLEGFEGEPDRYGERTVNGWKNRGLPTNLGKK